MKKKILAAALAAAMVLSMTACGGTTSSTSSDSSSSSGTEAAASESGDAGADASANAGKRTKVTVGLTNTVSSLQPFNGANPYYQMIIDEVYQKLGQRNNFAEGEFECVLMKSYTQVDDTSYDVEIWPDIYDSEGNHFTANDVKWSLDTASEQGVKGSEYYESTDVTDDTHCTIHLNTTALGGFETTCEQLIMVTQAAYEASPDGMSTIPVGTGPYVCTNFTTGSTVTLEKDDDFWMLASEAEVPEIFAQNVDVIEYQFLTETTQMELAVEQGNVQLAEWLNESIVEDCSNVDGYVTEELASPQICNILFNMYDNSPCSDVNLRYAICYAVDNQQLIDNLLFGVGTIPEAMGKAGQQGYNEAWADEYDYFTYDPEKAKEYLAKSSYNGETLIIMIMQSKSFETAAQLLQQQLSAVGINSEIAEYDDVTWGKLSAAATQDGSHNFDIIPQNLSMVGSYLMQTLSKYVDINQGNDGYTNLGEKDEQMQSLVDACLSVDWTQEDYDNYYAYYMEQMPYYQWYANAYTCAHVEGLSLTDDSRGCLKGEIVPGACVYPDDWSYFAE